MARPSVLLPQPLSPTKPSVSPGAMLKLTPSTALTDSRGLPRREWYRHMIYAPGLHTGYEAKTLPAIREAIEDRRWEEANQYIVVVAATLDAYRTALDRAISTP